MIANIIGFDWPKGSRRYKWMDDEWQIPEEIFKTCPNHKGRKLIPKKRIKAVLWCPECGICSSSSEKEEHIVRK